MLIVGSGADVTVIVCVEVKLSVAVIETSVVYEGGGWVPEGTVEEISKVDDEVGGKAVVVIMSVVVVVLVDSTGMVAPPRNSSPPQST